MEKDAELLKQKLLQEQKRREVCDDYLKQIFLHIVCYQEEMLAAEVELARQEEEKKLQAQKQLESVSPIATV